MSLEQEDDFMLEELNHKKPPPNYLGFIAGTCSGITKNTVGHPFDTIKVRLQTAPKGMFNGPIDCCMRTLKTEGITGFYKGLTPPLVGWVLMDSVMLGSLNAYRHFIKDTWYPKEEKLTLTGHCFAGLLSGWTVSFVAAPVEQVKARLQVQYNAKSKQFSGPIDVLQKLYKMSGIRGIYRGLFSTMVFRTNFIFWWGSYEVFTQWFEKNTNLSGPSINFWSGGLSATVFWIVAYPADVIKQKIMTDSPIKAERKYKTYMDAVRKIYETSGWKGFTRGFIPCIMRSFPANASALVAFEAAMRYLH